MGWTVCDFPLPLQYICRGDEPIERIGKNRQTVKWVNSM